MKTLKFITIAFLILVLGGCISSLNPLFTENELISNTDLIGNWREGDSQLSFTSNDDNHYILISSEGGEGEDFIAHLVRLGNRTFLDISPMDPMDDSYLFQATHFPVHIFFRIEIGQEQITLYELDSEMFGDLIKSSGEKISFVISPDDRILLTASTKELQDLVQKNEGLFSNPVVFRKEN